MRPTKLNITALKAFFSVPANKTKMQQAIYNTAKLGWSTDHVSNRNGRNFLAVRFRAGKLEITDRFYNDVTDIVKGFLLHPLVELFKSTFNGLHGVTTNNKAMALQLGYKYTKSTAASLEGQTVNYLAYGFDELGNAIVISTDKVIRQFYTK